MQLILPHNVWLTGQMGAGKDWVANVLVERCGFTRLSLADALKAEVAEHLGITLAELAARKAELRPMLQNWGTTKRHDPGYWIKQWQERRDAIKGPVVCADMRFPNEANYAMYAKGYFLARVETALEVRIERLTARDGAFDPSWLNHESEVHIPHLPVHARLDGALTGQKWPYVLAISAAYTAMVQMQEAA